MTELANVVTLLHARAVHIRKLMAGMVDNSLAVGKELKEIRDNEFTNVNPKGKRVGWTSWLRNEFHMSADWAGRLIRAYQKFGHLATGGRVLPSQKVLTFLAQDNVSEEARNEAIEHIKAGKKLGKTAAKKIVQKHRPSPKKANEQARATGKPVEASDGYVYFGATEAQGRESEQRRTIVFSVREAIACLAKIELQATEFLEYAMPHQLWKPREEQQIKDALTWLKELDRAWDRRKS